MTGSWRSVTLLPIALLLVALSYGMGWWLSSMTEQTDPVPVGIAKRVAGGQEVGLKQAPAPSQTVANHASISKFDGSVRFWESQPAPSVAGADHVINAWRIVGVSGAGSQLAALVDLPGSDSLKLVKAGERFPDGSLLIAVTSRSLTIRPLPSTGEPLIVLDL